MTIQEKTIIKLSEELTICEQWIENFRKTERSIRMLLDKVSIPTGFEDGNDWDDLSLVERVEILVKRYLDKPL